MNPPPPPSEVSAAIALADEFDKQRHCGWNSSQNLCEYHNQPEYDATDIPEFRSLGDQCRGTLRELALLHTLRPCRTCESDTLYKSNYQVSCCACFGDPEQCENRKEDIENGEDPDERGCCDCAENANLPDAITRWNLHYGDSGTRGRVQVIG